MKKILASLLLMSIGASGWAQTQDYKRPAYFGVSVLMNDFATPRNIRASSLSTVLNEKRVARLNEMAPGFGLHYFKGVTNHIDVAGSLHSSFATINRMRDAGDKFLLEADASANLKVLTERYRFTPYLIAGVGASLYDEKFDAIVPVGTGFKFNLMDEASVFVSGQYRIPVTNNRNDYHFVFNIGFAGLVGKKREPVKEVVIPQAPKDTDGDGITDDTDRCPEVPGIAKYNGCPVPDTDKDGINDEEDRCPTVAGLAKYAGCPIPDTDLDGINDEEDKCPAVYGTAKYGGCPVPDTDSDGVNDEQDRCPTVAGPASNNGCPVVTEEIKKRLEYAASHIYFATGSARLLSTSNKALNDVAKILTDDPSLKLSIEGHTDNVGKDDYNHTLSHNRAKSVQDYLIAKGIDAGRLKAQGFGETQPVADNKTAAGRAKNRRVVMTVSYE